MILSSCIDPVPPEFELEEGLIFVEGFASTAPGASFVSVEVSAFEFGFYVVNFVERARVSFINTATQEVVQLTEQGEAYVPPPDFAVAPGESWQLEVITEDGVQYISTPETVLEAVEINSIRAEYDPEIEFRESLNGFIAGHKIFVAFDDPVGEQNFYYWSFRSFENLDVCEKCIGRFFRDGECQVPPPGFFTRPYYCYTCESDCWRIRFPESVSILEDRFIDGNEVRNIEVAEIPLYTKEDIVIELQQFSITPAAFEFYEVLKDIVDDNRGLNAPPPAALIGNMQNVNDSEEFVFGRFTAAATSVASIFIDRTDIAEPQIEPIDPLIVERFGEGPPPQTTTAPCTETRFRTAIRPEAWIDQ
ncbi:MAG: DUF4249 domain-containing protein [Flavobacteriaceae bacterium]